MSKPNRDLNLGALCPACKLARRICLCAELRRKPKRYRPALWALDMDEEREDAEALAAMDVHYAARARAGRKPKPT